MKLIKIIALLFLSKVAIAENIYTIFNPEDLEERAILYPIEDIEDFNIWEMHFIGSSEYPIKVRVHLSGENKVKITYLESEHDEDITDVDTVEFEIKDIYKKVSN